MQALRTPVPLDVSRTTPSAAWPLRSLAAGAVYAAAAISIGTVLGYLRETWVSPFITTDLAIVVETPLMIWICFALAPVSLRLFRVPAGLAARTLMAAVAVGILLWAENLASEAWRGRSLLEQWGLYGWLALGASLAGIAGFALAPLMTKRA